MRVVLNREIAALPRLHDGVEAFAKQNGVDAEDTLALALLLEEWFTNLVRHAPGREAVEVELLRREEMVVLKVVDPQPGDFDPTGAPAVDTTRPIEEREPGGLGLHLMRRLADELRYEREDGRGVLTILRRLRS